jgi:hypothetical protein
MVLRVQVVLVELLALQVQQVHLELAAQVVLLEQQVQVVPGLIQLIMLEPVEYYYPTAHQTLQLLQLV